MGLLSDFVIKNPKIKFWLPIVMDVLLIAGLVFFALTIKGEYRKGWDACWNQACVACAYQTYLMSQNTSTTNITEIPENFTMFGNNT